MSHNNNNKVFPTRVYANYTKEKLGIHHKHNALCILCQQPTQILDSRTINILLKENKIADGA